MMKTTILLLALLAGVTLAMAEPKTDRPVGDDSTDLAPLNQKPKPLPSDRQVPPGGADQGGGTKDATQPR